MVKNTEIKNGSQQDGSFPPVFAPPVFTPPLFAPKSEASLVNQHAEISFFDVKELYEDAYAALNAGRTDYKAKEMMAQAIKMDMAYRCQLARKNTYQKTASRLNDFQITSKSA